MPPTPTLKLDRAKAVVLVVDVQSRLTEVLIRDTGINLAAFGLDGNGALYMLEWNFLGRLDKIYRVIATPEPAS
jgi:hypothetical protein